jgi:ubiquitin carboxyl-terminal hydrolase 8
MSSEDKVNMKDVEEERKNYSTRGTSGLENIGNTCYMNSTIQCLIATDLFVPYFRGTHVGGTPEYVLDLKQGMARIIAEEEIKKRKSKGLPIDGQITVDAKKIKQKFRESLTYEFRKLVVTMWGMMCVVKPKNFKLALERENAKEKRDMIKAEFNGSKQCDSQECFSFIIDRIHEETRTDVVLGMKTLSPSIEEALQVRNSGMSVEEYNTYKREHLRECAIVEALESWRKYIEKSHSVIEDIFGGMYYQSIKCTGCNNISLKFDPFKILTLHIPTVQGPLTIEDCLSDYFKDENLEGDSKYSCESCKCKQNAIKSFKVWQCPHRLLICFKRFDYSGYGSKNSRKILFPIEGLDMGQFTSEFVNSDNIYDLYAISYHSGDVRSGHYTAYTKNPINGEWYHFDDSNVLHINNKLDNEEFREFFKERLTSKSDKHKLELFIATKNSLNKKVFGVEETEEFLRQINCNNISDITDDIKEIMTSKLEKVLVTPGAYWLLYKKRENFEFAKYDTDGEDNDLRDLDSNASD